MKIVYTGPAEGVRLAPAFGGIWFDRGQPVEVPDDVGRSLCCQPGFVPAGRRRRRGRDETPDQPLQAETPGEPLAGTETPDRPVGEAPESEDPSVETR